MLLPREAYPLQKINKPLFPGRIFRLTLMLYAVVPITVWVSVRSQTVAARLEARHFRDGRAHYMGATVRRLSPTRRPDH